MHPLRIPLRGPMMSQNLVEFSEAINALLQKAMKSPLPETIESRPPEVDWNIELLRERIRKGGVYAE